MRRKVLIAATDRWFPTARLAAAMANSGCEVEAVCPSGHPLAVTGAIKRIYPYRGLSASESFAEAISLSRPDLIIPADDLATRHLHDFHRDQRRKVQMSESAEALCQIIERSIGSPESYPVVYARAEFIRLAEESGVRVPKTAALTSLQDLRSWVLRMGLPMVLKANGTSGGDGVRVVHTIAEAEEAFRELQAPPLLARAVKRAVMDQDATLIWPSLRRRRATVNAQSFISGHEATSAVACWQGKVLAALHFEVVKKSSSSGPATVLRLIEHPEMSMAAEVMAHKLKLSGVHGFDFMLESGTDDAYLIEINPRATQVCHLSFGPGRDIPAAICSAISGFEVIPSPRVTEKDTVALFPQEWLRNPESSFLRSAYHDIPWEMPELVRACAKKRQKQYGLQSHEELLKALAAIRIPRP